MAAAAKAGLNVEDVTQEMQEEVAAKVGLDGKEVCSHFKYVLRYYKDDAVLCEEFLKFCERESSACDEAELGPEAFKEHQVCVCIVTVVGSIAHKYSHTHTHTHTHTHKRTHQVQEVSPRPNDEHEHFKVVLLDH